jgi:hypothetical protein
LIHGFRRTGNPSFLEHFDRPVCPGLVFPFETWYRDLFQTAAAAVYAVERGHFTPSQGARQIFEAITELDYGSSTWSLATSKKLFSAISSPEIRDLFYRPERDEQEGADLPKILA